MADGSSMTRLAAAVLCCAGVARAAEPMVVLDRATRNVLSSTRKIPNYTCVETVERNLYQPLAANLKRACPVILEQRKHPTLDLQLHLEATDRLRFDVATVEKGEIFSWVGASHFEDDGVSRLVRSGPIATGVFASLLTLVFDQDVRSFQYEGPVEEGGRRCLKFSFEVPGADSHYRVQVRDSWMHTSYSGTILIDPEADRVVRLIAQTGELPEAAGSCMTTTTVDYCMVRIGSGSFLLASNAHQRFVSPSGQEYDNITTFAGCREYLGESTVTYETVEPAPGHRVGPAEKPRVFSPGLRFQMVLTHAIDSSIAAAGDPFEARLLSPLRDAKQKLVAPAASLVRGHLLRVESFHTNPLQTIVVLRPETVQAGGSVIALSAIRVVQNSSRGKVAIELPLPGEDHAGVFRFAGDHVVVPAFFRSDWVTTVP